MKFVSSCTHPHVFLNMYDFFYYVEHKKYKQFTNIKKKYNERVPVLF